MSDTRAFEKSVWYLTGATRGGMTRAPLGNPEGFAADETVSYSLPPNIEPGLVYLGGNWFNDADNMRLKSETGKVVLKYKAKNVNIAAGSSSELELLLNDKPLASNQLGKDSSLSSAKSVVKVDSERPYSLVDDTDHFQKTLTISVKRKGFRLYTFTFG